MYVCCFTVIFMPAYLGCVGIAVIPILQGVVLYCALPSGVLIGKVSAQLTDGQHITLLQLILLLCTVLYIVLYSVPDIFPFPPQHQN